METQLNHRRRLRQKSKYQIQGEPNFNGKKVFGNFHCALQQINGSSRLVIAKRGFLGPFRLLRRAGYLACSRLTQENVRISEEETSDFERNLIKKKSDISHQKQPDSRHVSSEIGAHFCWLDREMQQLQKSCQSCLSPVWLENFNSQFSLCSSLWTYSKVV